MNQYENRGYYEKATTYKKMLSKLKSTTTNDDTVKSLLKKIMLNTVGEHVRVTMGGDATEHVLRYVYRLNANMANNAILTTITKHKTDFGGFKYVMEPSGIFLCKDKATICMISYDSIYDKDFNDFMANTMLSTIGCNFAVNITFIGKMAKKYKANVIKIYKKHAYYKYGETGVMTYNPLRESSVKIALRSFDSVICKGKPELIRSIDKFCDSKDIYNKFNIPYQMGILLYGPPGCGKTSLVRAILKYVTNKYDAGQIYNFNLGLCKSAKDVEEMIDRASHDILNSIYSADIKIMHIIIMEELDQVCDGLRGENSAISAVAKAKINALLQFLDGAKSLDDIIVVATTNYIEKMDEALIRDGRFSCKIEVGPFDKDDTKELCDYYGVDYSVLGSIEYPVIPAKIQKEIFNKIRNDR